MCVCVCVLLPVCVHGDGARRAVVSTGRYNVSEGDHVVLGVLASLLPADGAAGLWEPLLSARAHTHTHTHTQTVMMTAGERPHRYSINPTNTLDSRECSGTMVPCVCSIVGRPGDSSGNRRGSVLSANIKPMVFITLHQEIFSWTPAWKRQPALARRRGNIQPGKSFYGVCFHFRD